MSDYGENLFQSAEPKLFEFGRVLRKEMTVCEKILWDQLRGRKLGGYKFRRQHPIDKYIADFYCHDAKIIVEVDGEIHNVSENKEYDINRNAELDLLKIKTLRFTNNEVKNNLSKVLNSILQALKGAKY